MAGHSQFSNIKHRKSAQDQKKSKKFTKIRREIFIAAKYGGADLESNPSLKSAVNCAKKQGFPKDKIEEAIRSSQNKQNTEKYEEVLYEGYGPHGVVLLLETLTDNRNRTSSDIRLILSKHGGSLGDPGSVSFLFEKLGCIRYIANKLDYEHVFHYSIEIGASDINEKEGSFEIICFNKDFDKIRGLLHKKFGNSESNGLFWKPKNFIELNEQKNETIAKLLSEMKDCNDVLRFYINADCS